VNTGPAAWVWEGGANVVGQTGTYGTEGVAAAGNIPPARAGGASWTDTAGNFWLFGGFTGLSVFNDLWKYNAGQWTWVSGANTMNQVGTYGTMGLGAAGNVPGARAGSMSWVDAKGNFWIFGGYDPNNGWFNDLWEYSSGQWTWVNGSNTTNAVGVYGTEGTAAAGNFPGARWEGNSWIDSAGDFWLFGGNGYDSANSFGPLNDLWKYSGGQWTWMSGSTICCQMGTYGTLGTSASANVPGGRDSAASWIDSSGNLWLFGGFGFGATTSTGALNDVWKYSAGAWTWMSGSSTFVQTGVYGTMGVTSAANVPAGRWAPAAWIDSAGNFWMFGGDGYDSAGQGGYLSDLWRYGAGQWTWMGGAEFRNQLAVYGTLGAADVSNLPGGRVNAVSWSDTAGNFWLFGGSGLDSANTLGELNDLWEYQQ
jgi:N-acetylneuraminic acid mutarotase